MDYKINKWYDAETIAGNKKSITKSEKAMTKNTFTSIIGIFTIILSIAGIKYSIFGDHSILINILIAYGISMLIAFISMIIFSKFNKLRKS